MPKSDNATNEANQSDQPLLGGVANKANPPKSTTYCHETEDGGTYWREWGKFVIETLTLVAVVFYGVVAYRQWCAMLASNGLTYDALIETRKATKQAETTFVVGEQAYLNIASPELDQVLGNIHVPIENNGKLPARNIVGTIYQARIIYTSQNTGNAFGGSEAGSIGPSEGDIIPPGGKNYASANINIPAWSQNTEMMNITQGKEAIFVAGDIKYDNGFGGTPIEFTFCRQTQFNSVIKEVTWIGCSQSLFSQMRAYIEKKVN